MIKTRGVSIGSTGKKMCVKIGGRHGIQGYGTFMQTSLEIAKNTNTLSYQDLKSKYFLDSSILDARPGRYLP